AGADDQHAGVLQRQPLLQRAQHAKDVGIEAVKFPILRADHSVAGAHFLAERIAVVQLLEDRFLERHGDAEAVDGDLAHAVHQVFKRVRVQVEIDGVDALAAERGVHHQRRKRVRHRIASHAIDAGGGIHLLQAVSFAQGASGDLPRRSLLARACGGKNKLTAGAHPQHPADDALLAHAYAHHGAAFTVALQKFHHHHVVVQVGGGGDDLDEIGGHGFHLLEDVVEFFGGAKIVVGKDERGFAAQPLKIYRLHALGGGQLHIHQGAAEL